MIRRPTLLICFAVWLGCGSGLRAEYASVMAPTEEVPHGLRWPADDAAPLSGLRFLSPIYLQELQREALAGSMAALPLLPLDPLTMDDEGAGPPPLIDTPSAAGAVAALLGAFELAADPWVTRFQPFRESIAVERLGGRLFRPPRDSVLQPTSKAQLTRPDFSTNQSVTKVIIDEEATDRPGHCLLSRHPSSG